MQDNICYIRSFNYVENEKGYWMTMANMNGLCFVDKNFRMTQIKKIFYECSLKSGDLFYCTVGAGDYIVLLPCHADYIGIYGVKDDTFQKIFISRPSLDRKINCIGKSKFYHGIAYANNIYFFGVFYPAIIKLDMQTLHVQYITDYIDKIEAKINISIRNDIFYLGAGSVRWKEDVYVPIGCCSAILKYNLNTDQVEIVDIKSKYNIWQFYDIDIVNDIIWVLGRNKDCGILIGWNPVNNDIKEIRIPYNDMDFCHTDFLLSASYKKDIYVFPWLGGRVFQVNTEKGDLHVNQKLSAVLQHRNVFARISKFKDSKLILQTWFNNSWYEYDAITESVREFRVILDDEKYKKLLQFHEYKKKRGILYESDKPLEEYLDYLVKFGLSKY